MALPHFFAGTFPQEASRVSCQMKVAVGNHFGDARSPVRFPCHVEFLLLIHAHNPVI